MDVRDRQSGVAARHAQRIEFALYQLALRIEESDGSDLGEWRVRQCEAIVEACVARAVAALRCVEPFSSPASVGEGLHVVSRQRVAA